MDADIGPPDIDMDADGGPPMVDCEDATVLFYVYSSEEAEVTAAADELGMSYETASGSSDFAAKAAASMPDIVVFSTPSGGYDDSVRTTLQTHLDSGGKAITAFWNYDAYTDLQTTLGVSVSGSISSPPTLSSSDADPAFWSAYESLPDTFAPSSSSWGDNGDKWSPAGVESLAKYEGEPIIVLSNDGSTIVNGLLFDNFAGADSDGDGTSDLTELVTNELYSLCGGGGPPPDMDMDADIGPPDDIDMDADADGGDPGDDGSTVLGVMADIGDAVLDFRCDEWDGDLCVRPQTRIPDGACDTHAMSGEWLSATYFNSPEERICPSFCQGMTGDSNYDVCTSGSETLSGYTTTGWGLSGYSSSDCSSTDYKWWQDTHTHTGGTDFTIRISEYGSGMPILNIQCSAW